MADTHRAKPNRLLVSSGAKHMGKSIIYFFLNWNVCIIVTFNFT